MVLYSTADQPQQSQTFEDGARLRERRSKGKVKRGRQGRQAHAIGLIQRMHKSKYESKVLPFAGQMLAGTWPT